MHRINIASQTNIVPVIQTTSVTVASFTVQCKSLELFKGASFMVNTFDINNKMITCQVLNMDQATYDQWNNNDNFIIQWTADKLGFKLI